MSKIQIKISKKDMKKYSELQIAVEKLCLIYSFEGVGAADAYVPLFAEINKSKAVEIMPKKNSRIEEICIRTQQNPGRLIRSNKSYQCIELDGTKYHIHYAHKDGK